MNHSEESILDLYRKFASGNESPELFHTWAGLSVISSAIGRRVWIGRGSVPPVYCNMYIVLTSPPGTKKTTALSIAKALIKSLKTIPVAGTCVTKEQIIVTMDTKKPENPCVRAFKYKGKSYTFSHYSIFASEFVNQLNAGMNPIGMIDFFTNIWDEPVYSDETKNKGSHEIVNPYLSILAAMTDYTARNLNEQKIVSAGMLRRCLFVMGTDSGIDIARPDLVWSPELDIASAKLTERLKELEFVNGPFSWTDEASAVWEEMYARNGKARRAEVSRLKREFYQTRPEYIQKVAMLLQLSNNCNELLLTGPNLLLAEKMITSVENGVCLLFEGAGRNEVNAHATDIVRMCETSPVFNQKALFQHFINHLSWAEFNQAVDDQIRIDRLAKEVKVNNRNGNSIVYVSTPAKLIAWQKEQKQTGKESEGSKA